METADPTEAEGAGVMAAEAVAEDAAASAETEATVIAAATAGGDAKDRIRGFAGPG